jgi:hypothetical protein
LQEHIERPDAKHQAERAVAIVGIEPIRARAKKKPHSRSDGFVACAGDLKEDFILTLELDFAVVQPTGKKHGAVNTDERVSVEAV